jgi:hypothetical protein
LRSNQNVDLAPLERGEDLGVVVRLPYAVAIPSNDPCAGVAAPQFLYNALSSGAHPANAAAPTAWALLGGTTRTAALMTNESLGLAVVGECNRATGARRDVTAIPAQQKLRAAAAIEKQYRLAALGKCIFNR